MNSNLAPTLTPLEARSYSPLALAFIGDAVYESFIRTKILLRANTSANKLHKACTAYVRAAAQSTAMKALVPQLSEEEEGIYKRGRNAHSATVPKHADVTDYRIATGFEALIGYLYLTAQKDRLSQIMELSYGIISENREKKL